MFGVLLRAGLRPMLVSVQVFKLIKAFCLTGALMAYPVTVMSDTPVKVVSVNLCTDQLAMLVAADIAVRVILPARDLKLGVATALVGAPLFLHLIYRTRRDRL